jgi:hypothetical protein
MREEKSKEKPVSGTLTFCNSRNRDQAATPGNLFRGDVGL